MRSSPRAKSWRGKWLPRYPNSNELLRIGFWPLAAVVLIFGIWQATISRVEEDYQSARKEAYRQAASLANAYAEQVHHTVEQIDQLTLNLKYDWEDENILLKLEKKRARGLFPERTGLYATIFNANGDVVTTSLATYSRPNVSDLPFFLAQKQGCCTGLQIWKTEVGRRVHRPVIRFTRRLNNPDGSFAGVAMVAVEPSYLMSYQDEGLSGKADFVSVRLVSGPLLATRIGSNAPQVQVFYKADPFFGPASGTILEPGAKFRDNVARIVAWRKVQDYPLIALAALSEQDALAPAKNLERSRYQMAAGPSLLIALLCLAGSYLSLRLVWRTRREEEVRATYRVATDAANEGFYMIRPLFGKDGKPFDFQLEDCNERGASLLGMSRQKLVGLTVARLKESKFKADLWHMCELALQNGIYEDEFRISQKAPVRATWVYRRMVRTGGGLALTVRDISESKEHEQTLSQLANTDALTKLPNRHWLSNFLPVATQRVALHDGHLAVFFIDLDNFKNVNDTLGHDVGDELLVEAAARLKNAVRASDHVVRLGGDEFTVILEHVTDRVDVERVAKSVMEAIAQPFSMVGAAGPRINASIGISMYPRDGSNAETLLKHADIAMYAAKTAGKGKYHFYEPTLSEELVHRLDKERALRLAVELDEFVIHYQPRVGANSGRLTSMEALIRWLHPERGLIYPGAFIDIAEDIGLISRIGELVIEKVCSQLALWRSQGLQLVPVSINVSPQQLRSGTLSAFLVACLKRYNLPSTLIEVELTESAVIDRSKTVSAELHELRRLGIKLMIDDFGAGYSSLAQLHRLDVDVLKVDQAFTRSLDDDSEGKVLFKAIVSMADALDMCVVAEGVETEIQLNALQALSCDEVQGYLVSRAVDPATMTELLLKRFLLPAGPAGRLAPA